MRRGTQIDIKKIKAGERLLDFPTPLQTRKSNSEKGKLIKEKAQIGKSKRIKKTKKIKQLNRNPNNQAEGGFRKQRAVDRPGRNQGWGTGGTGQPKQIEIKINPDWDFFFAFSLTSRCIGFLTHGERSDPRFSASASESDTNIGIMCIVHIQRSTI